MTFRFKGLLAFAGFAAILTMAVDSTLGMAAAAAALLVEILLWSGVFGLGRDYARSQRQGLKTPPSIP